jgi:hypothetical protein
MPDNRYLVGYMNRFGGFGAAEISLTYPVRGMPDVQVLTDLLATQVGVDEPVVISFSRFEEATR